jgi:Protein phosphatase 2C
VESQRIGPPEQNDEAMLLFALLVDGMKRDLKHHDLIPPPGTLRMWRISRPTLDDLRTGISSRQAPQKWPRWFHKNKRWWKLYNRPFLQHLLFAIEKGGHFGVSSADQILFVMEGVAQTFFTEDGSMRARNVALANARLQTADAELKKQEAAKAKAASRQELEAPSKPPTEPRRQLVSRPTPWPEVEDRTDESTGGSLDLADRHVTWASHIGPDFAQKDENQDAACVIANGYWISFALADGVGTSFGSRFAAAAIVNHFCRALLEELGEEIDTDAASALVQSAKSTHIMLDQILDYLLDHPDAPEWAQVGGQSKLQRDVIVRLAENTRSPKNRAWGPVLAATLIGGAVKIERGGSLRATLLRIGDGVVVRTADDEDTTLFTMNPEETEVECSVSPGPQSGNAIEKLQTSTVVLRTVALRPGDGLIVSSDGLTRGHHGSPVRGMLEEIVGTGSFSLSPGAPAIEILKQAVAYSEEKFSRDSTVQLFADNLSLIIFSSAASKLKGVQSGQK